MWIRDNGKAEASQAEVTKLADLLRQTIERLPVAQKEGPPSPGRRPSWTIQLRAWARQHARTQVSRSL
jgi:hypothetical protein